ncbi:zinc ribbon domain-containing protein [Zongyangia sp. HA2173]|uniref:zinc ribbon domain-containing protein n=1 Tax=Zongyangia sp. HA2173 TaxID=3133035 RepID=UPI0031669CAC
MAKFCGKCGSRLDVNTGLCPHCGQEKLETIQGLPKIEEEVFQGGKDHSLSIDGKLSPPIDNGKKPHSRRKKGVALKICLILLAVVILLGSILCALTYFDMIRIPLLSGFLHSATDDAVVSSLYSVLSGDDSVAIVDAQGQPVDSLTGGVMSKKMFESISYSIVKTAQKENILTATVVFIVPDALALVDEYGGLDSPEDDFSTWLVNRLDGSFPTVKMTVPVQFMVQDDGLVLIADEGLLNVLTGGALQYYVDQQKNAYEKVMEGIAE